MKLLAVVEDSLKEILVRGLACEIDFRTSWQEVDCNHVREYGHVIVSGRLVENDKDPMAVWGIASTIRYFGLSAVFIDVSFEAGNVFARNYPQIKVVSFSGEESQLLLQLRTCMPALFRDNASFMSSTCSALANAWRFENVENSGVMPSTGSLSTTDVRQIPGPGLVNSLPSISANSMTAAKPVPSHPSLSALSGSRQCSRSVDEIVKRSVPSSFGPVSSIPLGMRTGSAAPIRGKNSQEMNNHPSFRKEGLGNGRSQFDHVSEIDFAISDISSISAISGISEITNSEELSALEKAISNVPGSNRSGDKSVRSISGPVLQEKEISGAGKKISGVSGIQSLSMLGDNQDMFKSPSAPPKPEDSSLVVRRSTGDVMMGIIEFGTLIRVIHTLVQLKQTGTLEAMNDTRSVKIEFRQGKTFSAQSAALVLSALNWTAGEYNFNSSQMLSANAQLVDIYSLISRAVHEQLQLNPILRALEAEFNSYIALTDSFNPANHPANVKRWWLRCDGTCVLSEIMMASAVEMESVSRDIYQSWLCDEVCFLKASTKQKVRIEYEVSSARMPKRESPRSEINSTIDSADSSHLNSIRFELQKVRASFDTDDGYTILGLKPGCGTKALDDAYYAWINRYHTDRFVRFKDPSFIKLANELLMLMNSTYSKLMKVERNGLAATRATEEARKRIAQQNDASGIPNVSSRIGAGRARINTIHSYQDGMSNDELRSISSELRSIEQVRADNSKRAHIRPASISNITDAPVLNSSAQQAQYLKMSDVLARKRAQTQELLERRRAQTTDTRRRAQSQDGRASVSKVPAMKPKIHTWASASVTPDQHFQTAKKKLTLGLAQEALTSLQWALEAEPENQEYIAYHAYASFLVEPHKREECLGRIMDIYNAMKEQYHDNNSLSPEDKARYFAPCYFIGKIYISSEKYEEASSFLKLAAKLNPSDVDTQRCIRYITMQSEKKADNARPKGIFSMFKDRFKS